MRPHFDALLHHPAGPVLFRPPELFDRLVDVEHRRERHPAEAPAGGLRGVGHPAVVCAGQGGVHLRARGEPAEEERGVEHLHVNVQLVHVGEPGGDVGQLSRRLHRPRAHVVAPAAQPGAAVDEPEPVGSCGRRGPSARRGRCRPACAGRSDSLRKLQVASVSSTCASTSIRAICHLLRMPSCYDGSIASDRWRTQSGHRVDDTSGRG